MMSRIAFLIGLMFLVSQSLLASEVKAKRNGVKVTDKPNKSAKIVLKLKKGEALETEGRKGMYWKVRTPTGATAYVSVLAVKRQNASSSKLNSALRKAAQSDRTKGQHESVRARSAVMGVRGLDESNSVDFAGSVKPDYRLVYQMEDRPVSNKKVKRLERLIEREIDKKAH